MKDCFSWEEANYHLFGIKTGSLLILKFSEETSIELNNANSKEYKHLLCYLNENLPNKIEQNENY